MECVVFIGGQACGKSTFYRERFFSTHVRINLDMLKTRNREKCLVRACLETQQPLVIDNTNPGRDDRSRYILLAKEAGYRIVGYYFQSRIADALRRNRLRKGNERIPEKGVKGTFGSLELPTRDEGFDELYYVRMVDPTGFVVEGWQDEVR